MFIVQKSDCTPKKYHRSGFGIFYLFFMCFALCLKLYHVLRLKLSVLISNENLFRQSKQKLRLVIIGIINLAVKKTALIFMRRRCMYLSSPLCKFSIDTYHYFFDCPLHNEIRQQRMQNLISWKYFNSRSPVWMKIIFLLTRISRYSNTYTHSSATAKAFSTYTKYKPENH